MEPDSRRRRRTRWLLWAVLVASLQSLPHSVFADEDSGGAKFSHDPEDKAACQGNLNLILEAIQEYRKQHQDKLPDKLSDLTPDFIQNPKILVCPYFQKTGGLRAWTKVIRELALDPHTSYGYEFAPVDIGDEVWRGLPKRTWREFKERQMDKLGRFGSVVPIVRCHVHEPKLNLAYDGHIYESGLDWEENFAHVVPVEDLVPARIFADPGGGKIVVAKDFLPRDPRAPPGVLDLSDHYNGLLTDSWQGFPSNHLAQLPSGLQEFGGVPFDVRGVIQLRGRKFPLQFPEKVEGIRVNQKLRRIHFLHATGFSATPGTNVASYIIHYADSQVREIPIIYGQQIADWWVNPKKPFEPAEAKVAWAGQNEAAKAYGKALRLYQFSWDNPFKDMEVVSISFLSRSTLSAPFLIAITIDP